MSNPGKATATVGILRLAKREWSKLHRRRKLWILLAIAVLISQIVLWTGYAVYQSEGLRKLFDAETTSSVSWQVEDSEGNPVSVEVTCADLAGGDIPAEFTEQIYRFPEQDKRTFLRQIEEFRSTACVESDEGDDSVDP